MDISEYFTPAQITRLYKEKEHAEVEFTIGPIPAIDGIGKEIATQLRTSVRSNKTFYTDSNGRDFIKRIRDFRVGWERTNQLLEIIILSILEFMCKMTAQSSQCWWIAQLVDLAA